MNDERQIEVGVTNSGYAERRSILRLNEPFPALVRGRGRDGQCFEEELTLDNLSAYGLYGRLSHRLMIGDQLFVVVRFTLGSPCRAPGVGVAARSIVLRTERLPDGRCGVALLFVRHRLLLAPSTS